VFFLLSAGSGGEIFLVSGILLCGLLETEQYTCIQGQTIDLLLLPFTIAH